MGKRGRGRGREAAVLHHGQRRFAGRRWRGASCRACGRDLLSTYGLLGMGKRTLSMESVARKERIAERPSGVSHG